MEVKPKIAASHREVFTMSSIGSISSMISQYESLISGSSSSSSSTSSASSASDTSSLLSELESESSDSSSSLLSALTGTSSSSSSSSSLLSALTGSSSNSSSSTYADEIEALAASKTTALGEFYSYAKSLFSASDTLSGQTEDSSTLSYDDVSAFVTAYNNLVTYASDNSGYLGSTGMSGVKDAVTDNEDALSGIGITVNSDGTLSVDESTLESALSSDASGVASTLSSVADATKSSASSLASSSLDKYTESYRKSLALSAKLTEYQDMSDFIGQLLDSKS